MKFCLSLGMVLLCTLPTYAQRIFSPIVSEPYTLQTLSRELAKASVVYLGETHDRLEDHEAQLKIIRELYGEHRQMAIAMEMFQRPYQSVLDRYLAGKISEAQLIQESEYESRWGFPWENYAPILRFAKENQLPVLAINTPTEITRKVAREGLESLNEAEKRDIPPISEIRTDNAEYRQRLLEAFQQHQQGGHGSSTGFERFLQAQVLWDETMADRIAQFVQANPDYLVVVIVGQGHIIYGDGIPSRVARRVQVKQRSLLLNPGEDVDTTDKRVADFFWED